nr:unnamed protein product [Digitaria exilis]
MHRFMAEAVLLAVNKIGSIILGDDPATFIITKLSEKVQSLKELPRKVEQIRLKLTFMSKVIKKIGTVYLTDELVKSWIAEVRKVAYRVEDVVDKYNYHLLQLEEEGFLKKYFVKGTHYAIVFSEIADELTEIEKEIQQVMQMKDQWLQQSQLVPDQEQLTEIERQRSQDSFPEFVKDDDLVGIEENRKLLTGWLYSEEQDSTVITVSGMGGLGKSTLVTNVYEREKVNFPVHAWIVVSQIYTAESLAFHNKKDHNCPGELQEIANKIVESLFPEDHPMSRETLVRLWVAEGFVLKKEKNTPEEVAEGNLMELIHRNMLDVVDYDELGRVSTCRMHDIMRDLALSVAKEEKFDSAAEYGELIQVDKNVRRLSLCGWNVNTAPKVKFQFLRTLAAHGIISPSPDIVSSILSQSTYLTVLELQDSEITEVPAFIGNLFNLRYIGLRRTRVNSLPESIEKLLNLQTLDIKQTQIEKLPRGIVKVKKLRHLLADRFADEKQSEFRYFIGVETPKGLWNLEELQTLETVQASKDLAEQLKRLMQLRSIWIDNVSSDDCASLFATLSTMPLLSSLLISAKDMNETLCLQALDPIFPKLHRLIVRGRWADGTLEYPIFCNHGKHLKYLALSWCQLGEDPLGVLAPYVPNLTYLSLNRVKSASTLVLSAGCFPRLKTLVLKKMPNVKQMEIGDGSLPCIEGLYIVSLERLDKVPHGIESLLSLKKLWLLYLHRVFKTEWQTNEMHQKMQHVPEIRI